MKKAKIIAMWMLSIFMALVSFAYFPSITSIIAIVFAIIAVPIEKWQEILSGIGIRGWIKSAVLCVAFVVAIAISPAKKIDQHIDQTSPNPSYYEALPSKTPEKITAQKPEKTENPTDTPEKSESPNSTGNPTVPPTEYPQQDQKSEMSNPVPDPEPVFNHNPEPEPTPEKKSESGENTEKTIKGKSYDTIVYVSKRSNTIHSVNDCGGMKNYREMTLGKADERNYKYCPNCW